MHILVNNPYNVDNYIDLQYEDHDLEDVNQVPEKTTHTRVTKNTLALNQYKALQERLKDVESYDPFDVDAFEMGLVPDMMIPPKFKVPDFGKLKGLTCSRNHLRMYCRKMHA